MEPCLFRHGKEATVKSEAEYLALQWSHVFSDMVSEQPPEDRIMTWDASMEPCLFRHGKNTEGYSSEDLETLLQWSHVFSDMVSIHSM